MICYIEYIKLYIYIYIYVYSAPQGQMSLCLGVALGIPGNPLGSQGIPRAAGVPMVPWGSRGGPWGMPGIPWHLQRIQGRPWSIPEDPQGIPQRFSMNLRGILGETKRSR